MDVEYCDILGGGNTDEGASSGVFSPSLFVATRVISANAEGLYTMDAGDKRFADKYGAKPQVVRGASTDARFKPVSDEHGILEFAGEALPLGHIVEVMVPHCDPTVNLFDYIHVVEGDRLVDIWKVDARGVY